MVDKTTDAGKTLVKPGTFLPGHDPRRNLKGNPGSGYKQKWDKAVTQVAKEKGITKDEADMELFKVAYEQALKGNFQFFKDAMDRVYGPVKTETMMNVENLENLTIVLDRED